MTVATRTYDTRYRDLLSYLDEWKMKESTREHELPGRERELADLLDCLDANQKVKQASEALLAKVGDREYLIGDQRPVSYAAEKQARLDLRMAEANLAKIGTRLPRLQEYVAALKRELAEIKQAIKDFPYDLLDEEMTMNRLRERARMR